MLNQLSKRLTATLDRMKGAARITEDNIQTALREIRLALLEADVALPVVKEFIENVRNDAIGQAIPDKLNPGQTFVGICRDQLQAVLGGQDSTLNLDQSRPIVILLAGLQGAGKTTTSAKLGLWCKKKKLRTLLCSTDVYRPAAMEQLQTLCQEQELDYLPAISSTPVEIATQALAEAQNRVADVLIIDTAGRLTIDDNMMAEIGAISSAVNPGETLLVIDAMTGQDAAHTAKAFHDSLALTGVILTKADSDARGGAALSVTQISGAPIKFCGVGEKTTALETFSPERMAKRILGMGDILGLIEEAEEHLDKKEAQKLEKKIRSGKTFNLEDYLGQIQQMEKLGGMSSMIGKIPGLSGKINPEAMDQLSNQQFKKHIALIRSMTPRERRFPEVINASRKRRITTGSGTKLIDLNRLVKQHKQMAKMMKKAKNKGGMRKMMQQLQSQTGGNLPPF